MGSFARLTRWSWRIVSVNYERQWSQRNPRTSLNGFKCSSDSRWKTPGCQGKDGLSAEKYQLIWKYCQLNQEKIQGGQQINHVADFRSCALDLSLHILYQTVSQRLMIWCFVLYNEVHHNHFSEENSNYLPTYIHTPSREAVMYSFRGLFYWRI